MAQTTEAAFVICESLVKIYKVGEQEVLALQGLDLQVPQGELLAIVGTSGSGKSTLLNILGGLDRPTAGKAYVGGLDLLKLPLKALTRYRCEDVGFVWQQAGRNLIPYLTAQENIELPMQIAGKVPGQARRRALELLELVELYERRDHALAQLSGGEQQRVAIALALANEPGLLLADEPTGEVDSVTAQTIWQTLRRLNRHYGLTTIVVSHDARIAHEVDRVVGIRDGKTSTETVRQGPAACDALFRPPGADEGEGHDERAEFEELVVLDAVGRLQVPRNVLEEWGIGTRARIETCEEGILIKPVGGSKRAAAAGRSLEASEMAIFTMPQDEPPEPRAPWWKRRAGAGRGSRRAPKGPAEERAVDTSGEANS